MRKQQHIRIYQTVVSCSHKLQNVVFCNVDFFCGASESGTPFLTIWLSEPMEYLHLHPRSVRNSLTQLTVYVNAMMRLTLSHSNIQLTTSLDIKLPNPKKSVELKCTIGFAVPWKQDICLDIYGATTSWHMLILALYLLPKKLSRTLVAITEEERHSCRYKLWIRLKWNEWCCLFKWLEQNSTNHEVSCKRLATAVAVGRVHGGGLVASWALDSCYLLFRLPNELNVSCVASEPLL